MGLLLDPSSLPYWIKPPVTLPSIAIFVYPLLDHLAEEFRLSSNGKDTLK